ncbi:MAG: DUF3352 domain-containing protein [Armatimonadetes bacterium]|nr:DUF3352 domain-containing protein [Armatimonadota bacterium]
MSTQTIARSNSEPSSLQNRRAGKGLLGAVIGAGLVAVLGFAAYKTFLSRAGEAATLYIPSDAGVVVTVDLTPSDRQLETFDKIQKAIHDNGLDLKLDGMLKRFMDKDPLGAELRPFFRRNYAIAIWPDKDAEAATVSLFAVEDPASVQAVLGKHVKPDGDGIFALKSPANTYAAVMEDYLVAGNSKQAIQRVQAVHADKGSSVASLPAFLEARQALPKDANVMVFVSPKEISKMASNAEMFAAPMSSIKGADWMAYGVTIEPDGIAVDYQCPFDPKAMGGLSALANSAPFDLKVLDALPDGAYGLMGVSQTSGYWELAAESAKSQGKDLAKTFEEGVKSFEKTSGLSVRDDIVPGLKGDQVIAVYPGKTGEGADLDLVLVATTANGATPAALAARLRALAERESQKSNKPMTFSSSQVGDVTIWEIDPKSRDEMVRGLNSGFGFPPAMSSGAAVGSDMPAGPDSGPPMIQSRPFPSDSSGMEGMADAKGKDPAKSYADKSILIGEFADKVVVCTSRAIMMQMVAGKFEHGSLGQSESFLKMRDRIIEGSQSVFMVDTKRIIDAVRPLVKETMSGGPVKADDVLSLFGSGTSGMVGSGIYDGKVCKGRFFMPLDWVSLCNLVGQGMKGLDKEMEEPHFNPEPATR